MTHPSHTSSPRLPTPAAPPTRCRHRRPSRFADSLLWRFGAFHSPRPAFATVLVLWVVVIGVVILAGVQSASFRGAVAGREDLARVRAQWAARAGLEATIARLARDTEDPDTSDARTTALDMEAVAEGFLAGADYFIYHEYEGEIRPGPLDAHARVNINTLDAAGLLALPLMSEDLADTILDWRDPDDDTRQLGAEIGYYLSSVAGYEPRNADIRSIPEIELIAGADELLVRGEDWDLDNQLDPNEDDGRAAWPPDEPDGELDPEWSELITPLSTDGGFAHSGEGRVDLTTATPADVARLLDTSNAHAETIAAIARTPDVVLEDYIAGNLAALAQTAGLEDADTSPLTDDQLRTLLAGAWMGDPFEPLAGRVNINTASQEVLDIVFPDTPDLVDTIIAERDARAGGFTSVIELLDFMDRATLSQVARLVTVRSNVYVVSCRGRDSATGLTVDLVATIDRSRLPVEILEIRTR